MAPISVQISVVASAGMPLTSAVTVVPKIDLDAVDCEAAAVRPHFFQAHHLFATAVTGLHRAVARDRLVGERRSQLGASPPGVLFPKPSNRQRHMPKSPCWLAEGDITRPPGE
jgi:hypothetical protein